MLIALNWNLVCFKHSFVCVSMCTNVSYKWYNIRVHYTQCTVVVAPYMLEIVNLLIPIHIKSILCKLLNIYKKVLVRYTLFDVC